MKRAGVAIAIATLYLVFYQTTPYLGIPDNVIVLLYVLSPFVVVYMVYVVLKYGKPSGHTFEEKFYDDQDYIRNNNDFI